MKLMSPQQEPWKMALCFCFVTDGGKKYYNVYFGEKKLSLQFFSPIDSL